jgi:hypothetical protein
MRFQRNYSRKMMGQGIALAGNFMQGSGMPEPISTISNTNENIIPVINSVGPKFNPDRPPMGDLLSMTGRELKELEQEGSGIKLAGQRKRMMGCGDFMVSKILPYNLKLLGLKNNKSLNEAFLSGDIRHASDMFMNHLLNDKKINSKKLLNDVQALRNLHFRSLSRVSQKGSGIVEGFKKFGERSKEVLQSIARGVQKYAPVVEKGLNILGEVAPETAEKYGPGIKKVLGTAVKLAPLLL